MSLFDEFDGLGEMKLCSGQAQDERKRTINARR